MKCANCQHVSESILFKCAESGQAYDRASLQSIGQFDYLLAWATIQAAILGGQK